MYASGRSMQRMSRIDLRNIRHKLVTVSKLTDDGAVLTRTTKIGAGAECLAHPPLPSSLNLSYCTIHQLTPARSVSSLR